MIKASDLSNNRMQVKQVSLSSNGWQDYELRDSGSGQKLERVGHMLLVRHEPQARWKPALDASIWQQAHAVFEMRKGQSSGIWRLRTQVPKQWQIDFHGLQLQMQIGASRHIGIFPEQSPNWLWLEKKIQSAGRPLRMLNLFGYNGLASLLAARNGVHVTHVDASRSAIRWGQLNQSLSAIQQHIRWIVDDSLKFSQREVRRGHQYEIIQLDPPRFGRGPNGELWKFEQHLKELLKVCGQLLAPQALCVLMTAYDIEQKPEEIAGWMAGISNNLHGFLQYGWLVQQEKSAGRKINQAMYVRWSSDKN